MFPVHLIDNAFGGTAVFDPLFNFANKHQNGYFLRVTTDPNIGYNAALTSGPIGVENGLLLSFHGLLEAVGELPAPCFNDLIKCAPPPGKVRCCGNYEKIMNMLLPQPYLDVYKTIPGGHVNVLGLTPLGEIAIDEMMKLGIIIDVDHMSERSMRATFELAGKVPGTYPLVMGHNGLRERSGGKERNAPADAVVSVLSSGGMFGIGTAKTTPSQWVAGFRALQSLRVRGGIPNGALALGTDVDGFEELPSNGRSEASCTHAVSQEFYRRFLSHSGITTKSHKPDGRNTWDYILDGGVSHYGLMPEFLFDVKSQSGEGAQAYEELMN